MTLKVVFLQPSDPSLGIPLVVVLTGAALGAALLLGLALAAFLQRKSRPYLLIALALAALLARSLTAGLSMIGHLPDSYHHLFEHILDVAMAAFVIGAVYYARTVDKRVEQVGEQ